MVETEMVETQTVKYGVLVGETYFQHTSGEVVAFPNRTEAEAWTKRYSSKDDAKVVELDPKIKTVTCSIDYILGSYRCR